MSAPRAVPETVDALTGELVVVVQFADSTAVMTAEEACASMGVGIDQLREAMAGLVAGGWLVPCEDGTYGATIPGGER